MAGTESIDGESSSTDEGDPRLPIITKVFRSFLIEHFNLEHQRKFLHRLVSNSSLSKDLLQCKDVRELLEFLAKENRRGTYAAFIYSLDKLEDKYIIDILEGLGPTFEETENRENIQGILCSFGEKLLDVNPLDIIYRLKLTREEVERVTTSTDNKGAIYGASKLLNILFRKGSECFSQLIIGLREAHHDLLADELASLICTDDVSCKASKLDNICSESDETGTIHDAQVAYSDGGLSDDNQSGCESASPSDIQEKQSTELHSACPTVLPIAPADSNNLDDSQAQKNRVLAKEVPTTSNELIPQEEQEDMYGPEDVSNEDIPDIKPIALRNYQKELVAPALEGKNCVVVAPTGSGKTVIAARLAKAVHEREPNVGPRKGNSNPPSLVQNGLGSNKVIFIVNKVPLVKQQCDLFKQYIDGSKIMGLSGEMGLIGSLVDLLETKDILVMTAQILVNALQGGKEDNEHMELSKIGLLILDECHHCQKGDPYNEIMAEYCTLKLSSPCKERPQILGLTASMGVGKAKTRYKAQTHILTLCANLDAQKLCTVQNPDNLEELGKKRDKPTEIILPVRGRKDDNFKKVIEPIMAQIEGFIAETRGGDIIRKECSEFKCPPSRGTQAYELWLVKMQEYIAGEITNDEDRMRLVTCVDHLQAYNNSLYINRDARIQDSLEYLKRNLARNHDQDRAPNAFEQNVVALFKEKLQQLNEISGNPANRNPLLDCLAKTLKEALDGKDNSRGILFCRTRAATEALLAWIEETVDLKFLKPGRLIGCGGTGMTQKQQTELLSLFRGGNHQLIVATSVAEEGLDIEQCNVVIRYNYISNDIGRVQAQGRNRAKDGKFYLIVSEELKLHEKELMNQIREKMMFEATQNLQKIPEEDFLEQIAKIQKTSKLERKLKKSNSHLLKHDKKLMKVNLICRKCGTQVCTADDIKCIEDAHHVVLSEAFEERCTFVEVPSRSVHADIELRQKIFCGNKEKACTQEWGNQMLYKNCLVNLITPKNFVMKMPKGPGRCFKKWKDVPFKIGGLTIEELDKICNASDEDEEEDDDDGNEAGEEASSASLTENGRGDGDGTDVVLEESFEQHRPKAVAAGAENPA